MTAADPGPAARAALEALSTARVAQTSSTAKRVADALREQVVEGRLLERGELEKAALGVADHLAGAASGIVAAFSEGRS